MGRRIYRAMYNHRDFLPYAQAFPVGDEVAWKADIKMNSGDGEVGQDPCHFPPWLLFLAPTVLLDCKTATRIRQENHFKILKKRQRKSMCVERDARVSSRHPWLPSQGFPPETDCDSC